MSQQDVKTLLENLNDINEIKWLEEISFIDPEDEEEYLDEVVGLGLAAAGVGGKAASIGGVASKTGVAFAGSASYAVLAPIAAAVAGGVILYKYLNSIGRLKDVVAKIEARIKETTDPNKKKTLQVKLNKYTEKLNSVQAAARSKKAGFIQKTSDLKKQIAELKSKKSDPTKVRKLEDKLQKRMQVISKIGAKI